MSGASGRVLIILPTLNRAAFLKQTLRTIFPLLNKSVTLIVCDNASTEPGYDGIKTLVEKQPYAKYHRYEERLTQMRNFNRLFKLAKDCDYVAMYHDDDLFDRDITEKCVRFLDEHPNAGFVGSHARSIDENNKEIPRFPNGMKNTEVTPGQEFIEKVMTQALFPYSTPSILYRAAALSANPYPTDMPPEMDNYLPDHVACMSIAENWDVGYIHEKLLSNRIHSGQMSHRPLEKIYLIRRDRFLLYASGYLARHPHEKKKVARWRRTLEWFTFLKLLKIGLSKSINGADLTSYYAVILELNDTIMRRTQRRFILLILKLGGPSLAAFFRRLVGTLNRMTFKVPV